MSETRYIESGGTQINARLGSVAVDLTLESRNAASFETVVPSGGSVPLDVGELVGIWINPTDGTDTAQMDKLFGGTVEDFEVEDYTLGSQDDKLLVYRLTSWDHLADRFLANQVYASQSAGAIVEDLRTRYLSADGVTAGTIQSGPTIQKAVFPRWKVSQALSELAKRAGMTWYIDEEKKLHFLARETNTAPVEISAESAYYRDLRIQRGREKYRNRQIVQAGDQETATQTDEFTGDGKTRTFTTRFRIASAPTIKVNGTPKDVGINGVDSGKDWYWTKGERTISQDESSSVLTSADTLTVEYTGLVSMVVEAKDQAEIDARKAIEGGSGIYEAVASRPEVNDKDLALDTADGLLQRWGSIDKRVTLRLEATSATSGLRSGQLLTIQLPAYGLNGDFLIEAVRASEEIRGGKPIFEFEVEALSGNKIGAGWVDFFRELSLQGRDFVINENEVLTKLETRVDEFGFTEAVTVQSAATEARADQLGFTESLTTEANTVVQIGTSKIGGTHVVG